MERKQEGQNGPVSLTWISDKFESNGLLVPEKFNIDFQDDGHLGDSNQNNFSYFWSTSHLDTLNIVCVNCPFGSGEKVQDRFSTWLLGRPPWISNQNDFSYFWSISHPNTSYQISSQWAFLFRRRGSKQIFKMATVGATLYFWSERF